MAVIWLHLPNQNDQTDVLGSLALPEVGSAGCLVAGAGVGGAYGFDMNRRRKWKVSVSHSPDTL